MKNQYFMSMAIKKAKEGVNKGQSPFGACIVKGNKIISCCHNIVWGSTDISAHAEINAIRKACKKLNTIDLSGCVIYSTCEPCPMCFSAIRWARISRIVFGAKISDAAKNGFHELAISNKSMNKLGKAKMRISGDCLRKENLELFKFWSSRKDKRVY
jgi:guanine deaminase